MNLKNEKVSIRTIEKEDMLFIQELWGDKNTMLTSGGVYIIKAEDLDKMYDVLKKEENSINNHFIIESNGEKIGDMSIRKYNDKLKTAQIDLKINNSKRNNGYAKETLKLYFDYYFNIIDANEIAFEFWLKDYFACNKLKEYGFTQSLIKEDFIIMNLTKKAYMESKLINQVINV